MSGAFAMFDDLVLRDSNSGGGNLGITGSGLGLRLYALQDANWNVVALVSTSGTVQERFWYTAFGTATALGAEVAPAFVCFIPVSKRFRVTKIRSVPCRAKGQVKCNHLTEAAMNRG